jgi:hypothetical protein
MSKHLLWFVECMAWSQQFALVELDGDGHSARSISSAMSELELRSRLADLGVPASDIERGVADARARAEADRRTRSTPAAARQRTS